LVKKRPRNGRDTQGSSLVIVGSFNQEGGEKKYKMRKNCTAEGGGCLPGGQHVILMQVSTGLDWGGISVTCGNTGTSLDTRGGATSGYVN